MSPLLGRHRECEALDALVATVRAGRSQVLLLRGEGGIGKTALLDYAAEGASGCRVARARGDESENELAFAGLHMVCAPFLAHLDRIPEPQAKALATAFGLSEGDPPNRFFVGLAAVSLLAEVAEEQPLLCLVDDVQWLDQVSALTLTFVARRLLAERIGLVFAIREGVDAQAFSGLPELVVQGLNEADAAAILDESLHGRLDPAVRKRLIADTHGNPLALRELPRAMTPAEMAGGFGLPTTSSISARLEEGFSRRIAQLPSATQQLLVVAAAEPVGDPLTVWRAADALGLDVDSVSPAIEDGLVELTGRLVFRHPLVRSAAYQHASPAERRDAHRALANATDAAADPDRRAWHRAQAAEGPNEDVAAELESAADRARARGGMAAAAAFLMRSVVLTTDPTQRLERTLLAAEASLEAGAIKAISPLLASVDNEQLDGRSRTRSDLLRGRIGFFAGNGTGVPKLMLDAARRLDHLDVHMARTTYIEALMAAAYAGRYAGEVDVDEVARAALAAPKPPGPPSATDLLLDSLALLVHAGPTEAVPVLRLAGQAFREGNTSLDEDLRWLGLSCATASATWDYDSWHAIASRQVQFDRSTGALLDLPVALNNLALLHIRQGDLEVAALLMAEGESINEVTGSHYGLYGATQLAAVRGREPEATALIDDIVKGAVAGGAGHVVRFSTWALATLYNGLAKYERALAAAQQADDHPQDWSGELYLHELIEAAARSGQLTIASEACERLAEETQALGTEWPLGIEARCRALVTRSAAAESLYREAIERLSRTPIRLELARAQLLYGEWLRRENRRVEARQQLRVAHESFLTMGAEAFAERASRELAATGGTVRKRTVETRDQLTPQEAQIARLAAEGRTNSEIGAELFISARTVEWHLRKVFPKLGIASRRELRDALAPAPRYEAQA